jgi:hypothetical protein
MKKRRTDVYLFKKDLVMYMFEVIYPNEYNLLTINNFDISKAIDMLFATLRGTQKKDKETILEKHRMIIYSETFDTEKMMNLFYGDTSVDKGLIDNFINIFNSKIKGEEYKYVYKPHKITRHYMVSHDYKSKDRQYYDDNILVGPTFHGEEKIAVAKHLTKEYDVDTIDSKNKIFELVDKIRSRLSDKYGLLMNFESDLLKLGYMRKKYADEITDPNVDKKIRYHQYLSFQKYIWNSVLDEWNLLHSDMKNKKGLSDTLMEYIISKKTAEEVFGFLVDSINYYKNYDISRISVEKEKMELQELRVMRMNIFYNLTPEEKLELLQYEFGSDEWNKRIDSVVEMDLGVRTIEKEENIDDANIDFYEDDY